jgi:integrase
MAPLSPTTRRNAGATIAEMPSQSIATQGAGCRPARKSRTAVVDTDGHIPRDWFRNKVWRPALDAAQIELSVTMRDLRHAHASWLLAAGADIQVVKERLGHGSISTTQKYLHTLPDNDETAIDAFNAIRRRSTRAA